RDVALRAADAAEALGKWAARGDLALHVVERTRDLLRTAGGHPLGADRVLVVVPKLVRVPCDRIDLGRRHERKRRWQLRVWARWANANEEVDPVRIRQIAVELPVNRTDAIRRLSRTERHLRARRNGADPTRQPDAAPVAPELLDMRRGVRP